MEKRENDLMLNMVANPTFSLFDFNSVGLTAENTSLQDPSYYKSNPFIQRRYTKEDGRFDDKAFDQDYERAKLGFQIMASDHAEEAMKSDFKFAASNITVSPEEKDYSTPYRLIIAPNPTRQSFGLVGWDEAGKRQHSADELAQSSQVLLNPTTAGDNFENAKWGKDPHSGFFDYGTLVMAQWDEDGFHTDPITKATVEHKKGEYKIGPNGTYYYEQLDGRDIYGKKVLNKMNVLTEEGSALNKLDFLDSDDIDKSLGGTVMKNLALVGGMFLPYVGPVITGLSLVPALSGIVGTLGKMATGSDSELFSNLEGFAKSWELQGNVSEEAQQSTWNLENFINLIGDTVSQLKQQRFIFEKIPTLFYGKYAGSKKATDALQKGFEDSYKKVYESALKNMRPQDNLKQYIDLKYGKDQMAQLVAVADVNNYVTKYNKLGEVLSKGYMTAITVHDTYGEAKLAGASDIEATLLTLGYGMAEAALLNTEIGSWILPEIHNNRAMNKAATRKFMDYIRKGEVKGGEASTTLKQVGEAFKADKTDKRKWAQNVLNKAKDFFKGEYFANGSKAKGIVGSTIAGGLGEGVEEVSEEVLADLSKGLFNTAQWLQGDDTRMSSFGFSWKDGKRNWSSQDIIDRYGMSFLGGLVGGSITNIGTAFNINQNIANMGAKEAFQHIVYTARNGGLNDIRKVVEDYNTGASEDLAAIPTRNSDGTFNILATPGNSQRDAVKKMTNQILDFVENTLTAYNSNITDQQFLSKQILEEWTYQSLYNSQTALDFLSEFNTLNTELIQDTAHLKDLQSQLLDTNKNGNVEDSERRQASQNNEEPKNNEEIQKQIRDTEEQIKKKSDKLKEYLDGKRSVEFMSRALVEMNPELNQAFGHLPFPIYVEKYYGRKYEDLSEVDQRAAVEAFKQYKASPNNTTQIKFGAETLLSLGKLLSQDLPAMVQDIDTPEYKQALAAFRQIIRLRALSFEDADFMASVEAGKKRSKNLENVVSIFNPAGYNAMQQSYMQQREAISKQKQEELTKTTEAYNQLRKQREDTRDAKIEARRKEVETREARLTEIETEKQTAKGTKKASLTREANRIRKELNGEPSKGKLGLKTTLEDDIKAIQQEANQQLKDLEDKHLEEKGQIEENFNSQLEDLDINKQDALTQVAIENIEKYIQPIINKGYIDTATRQEISDILGSLALYVSDPFSNADPQDEQKIQDIIIKIENLPTSKVEAILNQFSISTTNTPFNVSTLIKNIYDQIKKAENGHSIEALESIDSAIINTLGMINLVKAALNAASTDDLSIVRGRPFGYNAVLNEISAKSGNVLNLATIQHSQTAPIIEQLNKLTNTLLYIQRIYKINTGNKFSQNEKALKAVTQVHFDKIKQFINRGDSNPFKDWEGWENLKATLLSVVDTSTKVTDLTDEELEKEKTKIEDAFYTFAQIASNKNKLSNVDELVKIVDQFDIFKSVNPQTANATITSINDLQLLNYIMASMSIKSSDFYSIVANTDFGGVAPIPLQIEAARVALSSIMNKGLYANMVKAIQKSAANKVAAMDSTTFLNTLSDNLGLDASAVDELVKLSDERNKKFWLMAFVLPKYTTMSLVEGIAGSGKTFAVFKMVDSILQNIPEFKDTKRYFVHGADPDQASVQATSNDIFGENKVTGFTRTGILSHMISDFKDVIEDPATGTVSPPAGTISFDADNRIISTQRINENSEAPTIMYIDEIGLFNDLDLQKLEEWAEKKNIIVIAAGDFHQNVATASIPVTLDTGDSINFTLAAENRQFFGSLKLGLSLRTGNSVKTKNQQMMETFLSTTTDYSEVVSLEYLWDGDNLKGDQVFLNEVEEAYQAIKRIAKTLQGTDDRITYIYDDDKSALYNKVTNDPILKDKIIFKRSTSAQGKETRYSVVDINKPYKGITARGQAAKFIYTGLTRAKQGTIIYQGRVGNDQIQLSSGKIQSAYSEDGYEQFLQAWTKNRLDFLKNIYPSGNPLVYIPYVHTLSPNSQPGGQSTGQSTGQPAGGQQAGGTPSGTPSSQSGGQTTTGGPQQGNGQPTPGTTPQGSSQPASQQEGQANNGGNSGGNAPISNVAPVPKFKVNDKVNIDVNNSTITGIIETLNFTTLPDGTNQYKITLQGDPTTYTLSEDAISEYVENTPVDQRLQEYLDKAHRNMAPDDLKASSARTNAAFNSVQKSLSDQTLGTPLTIQSLQNYPFIGLDSIEDLIKLLDGDLSLLQTETNVNNPHLIYLFNDGNPINNLSDIKQIFMPDNLVALDYFADKYPGKYNVLSITDIGQFVWGWDYDRQQKIQEEEEYVYEEWLNSQEYDTEDEIADMTNVNGRLTWGMDFDIGFYSMNSLELGAVEAGDNSFEWDRNGQYRDSKGRTRRRLDGVNGFLNLAQIQTTLLPPYLLKAIGGPDGQGPKDRKACLSAIAYLQNTILNNDNKADIEKLLAYYFTGDQNNPDFFINFGITKRPSASVKASGNDNTSDTQMHKDPRERVYGLDTTAKGSEEVSSTQLVAIIGHQSYGEFLEIPLFSISNPISLLLSKTNNTYNYPAAAQAVLNCKEQGLTIYDTLQKIKNDLDASQLPESVRNYIDLYTAGNSFLFRFGILKKDANGRIFNDSSFAQWCPRKNLNLQGISFTRKRGAKMYNNDMLDFDITEVDTEQNLQDFINTYNDRFKFTSLMQAPNTGILAAGVQVQAGHNFIIASQDTNLTESQILQQYINEQRDSTLPRTTKLIYVIPPKATVQEYRKFLMGIPTGANKNKNYKIGYKNTIHRLLDLMYRDPELKNRMLQNLLFQAGPGGFQASKERFEGVLRELNRLYEQYRQNKTKESLKVYSAYLNSNYPNTSGAQKVHIFNVLSKLFTEVTSSYNNNAEGEEIISDNVEVLNRVQDLINSTLNDPVVENRIYLYYTTKQGLAKPNGVTLLTGVQDYTLDIDGRKVPFTVRGKLDSYKFTGRIPMFNTLMKFVKQNSESKKQGNKKNNSRVSNYVLLDELQSSTTTLDNKIPQQLINSLLTNMGIQYQLSGEFTTLESALDKFVQDINNSTDLDFIVYRVGKKLGKTRKNWIFQNNTVVLTDSQNQVITEVPQNGNFKIFVTHSDGTTDKYEATYEKDSIWLYSNEIYPNDTDIDTEFEYKNDTGLVTAMTKSLFDTYLFDTQQGKIKDEYSEFAIYANLDDAYSFYDGKNKERFEKLEQLSNDPKFDGIIETLKRWEYMAMNEDQREQCNKMKL